MKTILYRLSENGFVSYEQTHHIHGLELGLKHFKNNGSTYPEHLKPHIEHDYREVLPEWKEFTRGIFAFMGHMPDKETVRILTNHLTYTQKKTYTWWSGEIDVEQYVFDANQLWRKNGFQKIDELLKTNHYEVFVPEQFLKVTNVQQWSDDYRSIYHISEEGLDINGNDNSTKKKYKIR